MTRAVRQSAASRRSSSRPAAPLPLTWRPGRSRVRRQRLIATYDKLPAEAQGVLVALAGDLWRATLRNAAAAQAIRVEGAPAPHIDVDRELLLATIRRAHAHSQRDKHEDRA